MSCGTQPASAGGFSPLVQQQREVALRNAQLRKEMRVLQEAARGHLAAVMQGQDVIKRDDPLELLLEEESFIRQRLQHERSLHADLSREADLLQHDISLLDEQLQAERLVRAALLRVLSEQRNSRGLIGSTKKKSSLGNTPANHRVARRSLPQRKHVRDEVTHRLELARCNAQAALEKHALLVAGLGDEVTKKR